MKRLTIVYVGLILTFIVLLVNFSYRYIKNEIENRTLKRNLEIIGVTLTKIELEKDGILKDSKGKVANFNFQREELILALEEARVKLNETEEMLDATENKIVELKKNNIALTQQITSVKEIKESLEAKVNSLTQEKASLEAKLSSLKELKKAIKAVKVTQLQTKVDVLKEKDLKGLIEGNRGY